MELLRTDGSALKIRRAIRERFSFNSLILFRGRGVDKSNKTAKMTPCVKNADGWISWDGFKYGADALSCKLMGDQKIFLKDAHNSDLVDALWKLCRL